METKLLSIKGFSTIFKVNNEYVVANRDINIDIFKGEIVGIVGESGSGKSVLAKSIIGLMAENQEYSGEIVFRNNQDVNITEASKEERKKLRQKEIFYFPQNSLDVFDPYYNAQIEIESRLNAAKSRGTVTYENVDMLINDVQLKKGQDDTTTFIDYSGGQKQLTLLAEMLADPPVLAILDEPTTAIDHKKAKGFIKLLKNIQRNGNFTIIIISHDILMISKLVNKIYVMYGGEILEAGPSQKLMKQPAHPYTKLLLESVPDFHETLILNNTESNFNNIIKQPAHIFQDNNPFNRCVFLERCVNRTKCIGKTKPLLRTENGREIRCHFPISFWEQDNGRNTKPKVRNTKRQIFEVKNLSVFSKKDYKQILDNVNFEIFDLDRVGLVGGSGEGKTTILKSVLKLDPSLRISPDYTMLFESKHLDIDNLRTRIQYIPQVFDGTFLPGSSVYQAVTEALQRTKFRLDGASKNSEVKVNVMNLLKTLGLDMIAERSVTEVSGGQRQRIAIARALIALDIFNKKDQKKNRILMMDEPTSSLDVTLQSNFLFYLDKLQQTYNLSYLIISHDLPLIYNFCRHFYVICKGKIEDHITEEKKEDLFKSPLNKKLKSCAKELFSLS